MRVAFFSLLGLLITSGLSAQLRPNLNNWFLAINGGATVGHTDIRPEFDSYMDDLQDHIGYSLSPEISYHFTHGFAFVTSFTWAQIQSNEFSKNPTWRAREYDTRLKELKFMGHLNLARALSFNKRKNIISPYVNAGMGSTWGKFKAPLSNWGDNENVREALAQDGHDTTSFQTWNKVFQVGFYIYLTRYIDLDIRYGYTFYNEDYIDGSWPHIIANREWDKYSSLNLGVRFKFGANTKKSYEHTSWARELMEEDTALYNNYVEIEEFDDGYGNPVYKLRRPDNINEEELTKIDTDNSSDDDMYQAVYNTLMQNPDLRDSIMAQLTRDLQNNNAFINRICIECGSDTVIIKEVGNSNQTVNHNHNYDQKNKNSNGNQGVGNINKGNPKVDEFELRDIYYDLDESFIRNDASSSLDELAKVLKKYPNLKVELGSHTDCRNSKNYNLALSQKRAMAAVNYLACQGIERCRLVAKAYGESNLVNKCDCEGEDKGEDCSDEEHQRNRRTTVKILDYNYKSGQGGCQEGVDVDSYAQKDANENSIDQYTDISTITVTDSDISEAGVSKTAEQGYYIVVGASYHPKYAMSLATLAKDKEDFQNSDVLYLNNNKYFVYVDKTTDYQKALAKLKEVRCCTRFPDAWLYAYKIEKPSK